MFRIEDIFPKQEVVSFEEKKVNSKGNIKITRLTFLSTFTLDYPENNRVVVYHYYPFKERYNNAIVILHGWKSSSLFFENTIAYIFARFGFHSFVFILPFHFDRTPQNRKNGELFFTLDQRHSIDAYKQAVIDLLNLADILTKKGFQIGIIGTSLGAIILNTLMGIDRRFRYGVSILGGGNIHRIIWEGILGKFVVRYLKKRGITERDYEEVLKDYDTFLKEIRITGTIPIPRWDWFLLDPLTYAVFNHPRKIIMFNGIFDMIIPRRSVYELKKALGDVQIYWLPAFHFTIFLFFPFIIYKSIVFFKKEI